MKVHHQNTFLLCHCTNKKYCNDSNVTLFHLLQAALQEIRSGFWFYNGHQIKCQAQSYMQSYFCNSMLDLDVFFVQVISCSCVILFLFLFSRSRTIPTPIILIDHQVTWVFELRKINCIKLGIKIYPNIIQEVFKFFTFYTSYTTKWTLPYLQEEFYYFIFGKNSPSFLFQMGMVVLPSSCIMDLLIDR